MKTFDRESSGEAIATGRELKTKKIITTVDLMNGPGEALDFAVEIAQQWQADLCIMYVYGDRLLPSWCTDIHAHIVIRSSCRQSHRLRIDYC